MKNTYFKISAFIALLFILPLVSTYAHKVVITVQNFSFAPASITNVSVGDTVRWNWVSGSHTTTSTSVPTGAATWNSSLTSANPSFEYLVTKAGVYNYKCTPHESMGMVGTFTASDANGIADNTFVFGELRLSPNPASESVKVRFSPINSFNGSVRLLSLVGSTVWEQESRYNSGSNLIELSLINIPKGLYFVELKDDKNNRVVKRVIVQ